MTLFIRYLSFFFVPNDISPPIEVSIRNQNKIDLKYNFAMKSTKKLKSHAI